MSILLFVLISVMTLLLISGGYVFFTACAKNRDIDWLDEQAVSKTQNAQYYPYMVTSDCWLKDHNAQHVYTTAEDGVQLHALWIPAKNSSFSPKVKEDLRLGLFLSMENPTQDSHLSGLQTWPQTTMRIFFAG